MIVHRLDFQYLSTRIGFPNSVPNFHIILKQISPLIPAILYQHLLILLLTILPGIAWSQIMTRDTSGAEVDILNAAQLQQLTIGDTIVQQLEGKVILQHDSLIMYCDTAIITNRVYVRAVGNIIIQQGDSLSVFSDSLFYNGNNRLARLAGKEVILANKQERLFTRELLYDAATSVATYLTRGLLDNGRTQLSSQTGTYFVNDSIAIFRDSVVVVDSLFTLRTDSLQFETDRNIARYYGPTRIDQGETDLYCESGYYDITNEEALFAGNAQYRNGTREASADSMRYEGLRNEILLVGEVIVTEPDRKATAERLLFFEDTEEYRLFGNAWLSNKGQEVRGDTLYFDGRQEVYTSSGRSVLSDSSQILEASSLDFDGVTGLGFATGGVYWQDTTAGLSIVSESADYNRGCEYMLATGTRRPLFISETEGDSLFMTADTLMSPGICDSPSISGRRILAYRDVRIFSSDLQGICDSLLYSEDDSLFTLFPLSKTPLLWSDTSMMKGDTIRILLSGNAISKVFLSKYAWLVNSPDLQFFNQIKGRDIVATFREEQLHEVIVNGNAEAVYYILDETGAYVGPNQASSSSMRISFHEGQVSDIRLYNSPEGELKPLVGQGVRLSGFPWSEDCRPKSVADLFPPEYCDGKNEGE